MQHKEMGDIKLRELNHKFITDYEFFLKTVRNVEHNTAMGIIKKLKKVVRIGVANDWIEKDPFMNYKVKIRDTNRPFLLQDELDKIIALKFTAERLANVRDIFVFCCYTGLAYADVQKLRRVDIVIGHDGEKWIHTERVKTETPTRIPLLPQAMKIMDAYKDHPQCVNQGKLLPVLSNAKMNEYLKEIADRCEINKKMTFHTARHTFATTVTLTNGVPIETVSKMLGQSIKPLMQTTLIKLYTYLVFKAHGNVDFENYIVRKIEHQTGKINPKFDRGSFQKNIERQKKLGLVKSKQLSLGLN